MRNLPPGVTTYPTRLPNSALLFGSPLAAQVLWLEPNGRAWLSPAVAGEVW